MMNNESMFTIFGIVVLSLEVFRTFMHTFKIWGYEQKPDDLIYLLNIVGVHIAVISVFGYFSYWFFEEWEKFSVSFLVIFVQNMTYFDLA